MVNTVLPPTYSRRKRQALGTSLDVYRYDEIPDKLRIQVTHIFSDAIGEYHQRVAYADPRRCYDCMVDMLRKEFGVFNLDNQRNQKPFRAFL